MNIYQYAPNIHQIYTNIHQIYTVGTEVICPEGSFPIDREYCSTEVIKISYHSFMKIDVKTTAVEPLATFRHLSLIDKILDYIRNRQLSPPGFHQDNENSLNIIRCNRILEILELHYDRLANHTGE